MSTATSSDHSPFQCSITPRYTDLDTWRHVNNSRIYQLHLEARIQAHIDRFGADAWFSDGVRLRPLRTLTQFRKVTWYGQDVQAQVQVLDCQDDHYRLRSELFQNGEHVGTQDALVGAFEGGEQVPLPSHIRQSLQAAAIGAEQPLPAADYVAQVHADAHFPAQQQLTPRYSDMDADSQRSEASLARYMEQARFGSIRQLDLGGLGILIASMDISFKHYRPSFKTMELAAGINRIGNTSFAFTGYASGEQGIQVIANSIMVVVDQGSGRPAPLPDALRQQLARLSL